MNFDDWKRLIQHRESSQRAHAADQLPDSGDQSTVISHLIACLDDPEPVVRVCAADTLGQFPVQQVRQRLLALLTTETDDLVKSYLVLSLAAMKNVNDLSVIANHIQQDVPATVRARALCGLIELVATIGVNDLLRLCDDSDWRVRGLAFNALNAVRETMQERIEDVVKSAIKHRDDEEISALARSSIEQIIEGSQRS